MRCPSPWKATATSGSPSRIRRSLTVIGLSATLPHALYSGLLAHGVSPADATRIAHLSPVSTLFASLLGASLVGPHALHALTHAQVARLTGRDFFPRLISPAFAGALSTAFWFPFSAYATAAAASALRGDTYRWSATTAGDEEPAVPTPAALSR